MTTQNSAMGDEELERILDEHAKAYGYAVMNYITGKLTERGRDRQFHLSDIKTKKALLARDQQIALAAQEKLLLRLKDSGDLNEMQSSYWLSTIDLAKSSLKQAQNKER